MKTEKVRVSYEFRIRYDTDEGRSECLKELKDRPVYESCAAGALGSRSIKRIGKGRLEGDS